MRAVGIDVFLWRAGDVNPLIDRVDTAKSGDSRPPLAERSLSPTRVKYEQLAEVTILTPQTRQN